MNEETEDLKIRFLPLETHERKSFFQRLSYYVYVYCETFQDSKRIPIYIGKGRADRCLSHLNNVEDLSKEKNAKIAKLISEDRLGIDILAYGLDEPTALAIEAACIDLMGIENLTNLVRGHGIKFKRAPLSEVANTLMEKTVMVRPEHKGVAIVINKIYEPWYGDIELFEATRGIWSRKMVSISKGVKFAYATFNNVVKEVYEIHSWVPAGTQQYFTRELNLDEQRADRWEFIGRIAEESVRKEYLGKIIKRPRSYGDPFIKVGFRE